MTASQKILQSCICEVHKVARKTLAYDIGSIANMTELEGLSTITYEQLAELEHEFDELDVEISEFEPVTVG